MKCWLTEKKTWYILICIKHTHSISNMYSIAVVISIVGAFLNHFWNKEHFWNNYLNRFQYQTTTGTSINELSNAAEYVWELSSKLELLNKICKKKLSSRTAENYEQWNKAEINENLFFLNI